MSVPTRRIIAYAIPALPLAALSLPIYIYLPTYYAQDIGLGLAQVGFILLLVRLLDVVSDPVIGYLSDRTRTPVGARKPWILAGLLPVMAASYFLLMPSEGANGFYLGLWSAVLYIGWTAMILPLNAWGAEMSDDYHKRTVISGWREGLTLAGTIIFLVLAALNENPMQAIALSLMIALPICVVIQAIWAPATKIAQDKKLSFKEGKDALLKNRTLRRLLFAYGINALANALPATLFLMYVQYVLEMKGSEGPLLLIYFAAGMMAVPMWSWLSKRFGKHLVWSWAMIWACCFFMLVPFVGAGDYILFLMICILTGISLGADMVLPASMQADIVDLDRLETGRQRTGLFFALWSIVTKLPLAFAAGIAFPLLAFSGFEPDIGQTENTYALITLYALAPVALKLWAVALMRNYDLDKKRVLENQTNF